MSFSVMVSKGVLSWDGGKCLQNISALTQLSRPSGETQPLLSSPGWCNRLCKTHRRALKTQSHQKLKVNPYSFFCCATCQPPACCVADDFALYLARFAADRAAVSHRLTAPAPGEPLSGPLCMKHTQLLPQRSPNVLIYRVLLADMGK